MKRRKELKKMSINISELTKEVKKEAFPLYKYGDKDNQIVYGAITDLAPGLYFTIDRFDDSANIPIAILLHPDFTRLTLKWRSAILREAIDKVNSSKRKSSSFTQMLNHALAMHFCNLRMIEKRMAVGPNRVIDVLSYSIMEYSDIKDANPTDICSDTIIDLFERIMKKIVEFEYITQDKIKYIINIINDTYDDNAGKLTDNTPGIKIIWGLLSLVQSHCINNPADAHNDNETTKESISINENIDTKKEPITYPDNKDEKNANNKRIRLVKGTTKNGKHVEIYYSPNELLSGGYSAKNASELTINVNDRYINLSITQQIAAIYEAMSKIDPVFNSKLTNGVQQPEFETVVIMRQFMLYNMYKNSIISLEVLLKNIQDPLMTQNDKFDFDLRDEIYQ